MTRSALWLALATAAVAACAGCASATPTDGAFIRDLAVSDAGGAGRAPTLTVRMAVERNWDPSAVYRLFLDVDQDGNADHRIETRFLDGRWFTAGGPKGTTGSNPKKGPEAIVWRVPGSELGATSGALHVWVEADTPQGLFRKPAAGGDLHVLGAK